MTKQQKATATAKVCEIMGDFLGVNIYNKNQKEQAEYILRSIEEDYFFEVENENLFIQNFIAQWSINCGFVSCYWEDIKELLIEMGFNKTHKNGKEFKTEELKNMLGYVLKIALYSLTDYRPTFDNRKEWATSYRFGYMSQEDFNQKCEARARELMKARGKAYCRATGQDEE